MGTESGSTAAREKAFRENRHFLLLLPVCLALCLCMYALASAVSERRFAAALEDAERAEPQTREGTLFYNALSAKEQMLYDALVSAAEDEARETEVLPFVPTAEEFSRAREAFLCEHPEYYTVDSDAFLLKTSAHTAAIQMAYCDDASDCRERTEAVISRILSGIPDGTEYDIMLYLHDELTACAVCADGNGETDEKTEAAEQTAALGMTAASGTTSALGTTAAVRKTAAGALCGIPSDSRAYALAYSLLCSRAGLSCRVVTGYGENGETLYWNTVSADGKTGFTDVFWDDSPVAAVTLPFHGYCFLDRAEMERDHRLDARFADGGAEDTVNFYESCGYTADADGLDALLDTLLAKARETGDTAIEFSVMGTENADGMTEIVQAALENAVTRADGSGNGSIPITEFRVYRASNARPVYTVQLFYE